MLDFNKIRNKSRKEAVRMLDAYLRNPSRFSILILGKPGTGKSHWVKQIQAQIQKEELDCSKSAVEKSLRMITPTKEAWVKIFREANQGILILEDVKDIKPHDAILFEALSTTDGTFGFDNDERFSIRIVFTSNYSISALRKTEEYISHQLFDRIAQLVVEFPSLREENRGIWEDFKDSWNKMKFFQYNELPGIALKNWLEGEPKDFLHGNFRDLDKIAILWHQFRLMNTSEKEILKLVESQLLTFSAYPEKNTELGDVFYFKEGIGYKELLSSFKHQLRDWAEKTYKSKRKAEQELGIGNRTMDKW